MARLQSSARRYCEGRHAQWSEKYHQLGQKGGDRTSLRGGGWGYTSKAKDTYPRYNVLAAILAEIERVAVAELGDLAGARANLAAIIHRAQNRFTEPPNGDIEEAAMDEERELAIAHVTKIDEATLWETRLLPLRRTLDDSEIEQHWSELKSRWKVDGYWIPLSDVKISDHFIVMDAAAFRKAVSPVALQNKLRDAGVAQLYEIREYDASTSTFIDVGLLDPGMCQYK